MTVPREVHLGASNSQVAAQAAFTARSRHACAQTLHRLGNLLSNYLTLSYSVVNTYASNCLCFIWVVFRLQTTARAARCNATPPLDPTFVIRLRIPCILVTARPEAGCVTLRRSAGPADLFERGFARAHRYQKEVFCKTARQLH